MTETPGGPHVDPKKQTKTNGSPESWHESPNCPRICAWPHLYPKFHCYDWLSFPDISSRSTNGDALVPGSRDTPLTRSVRLYYSCIPVTAYCWFRGIVFIKSRLLLSLPKSAIRGLSKDETLNSRQLKPENIQRSGEPNCFTSVANRRREQTINYCQ